MLFLQESKASTWMQLEQELRQAIEGLKSCSEDDLGGRSQISLGSGCDLFMKYLHRAFSLEFMVRFASFNKRPFSVFTFSFVQFSVVVFS
jgi:hypothetical protein